MDGSVGLLAEPASLRFLESHRHVGVLGPVGVGKTFLASALGHLACFHGYHVRCVRADEMLRTLRQSRVDNSREAIMAALIAVDLLIRDDFALETMSKEESKDVYQLFLDRTGRGSMIVTSNRDTAEWHPMFDDMRRGRPSETCSASVVLSCSPGPIHVQNRHEPQSTHSPNKPLWSASARFGWQASSLAVS